MPTEFINILIPQALAGQPLINTCPIGSLSCTSDLGGYFAGSIIPAMRTAFFGILFGMLIFYGIKMLIGSMSESQVTEARMAYLYSFIGTVLVFAAAILATSIVTFDVADSTGFDTVLNTAIDVLTILTGTGLSINIVYQAIRLIVAEQDGQRDSARKQILFGFVGAFVVVLARSIATILFDADPFLAIDEIEGVTRFLATVFGTMAFMGIVVSGIMLVVSYDDSLKDRAKKLFFASIIALGVVLAAYAIVGFFVFPVIE